MVMKMSDNKRKSGWNPHKIGTRSKQRVCLDLIEMGYDVFEAVGQPDIADFVVCPGLLLVKVKTARLVYKSWQIHKPKNDGYDILAKVRPDIIVYDPPLEALSD